MSELVTITVNFNLKPEAVETFCGAIKEFFPETANFPGFHDIRLVQHENDPTKLMLVERWESADAFKAYVAWRTETGVLDGLGAFVTAPPQFNIWPKIIATAERP